MTEYVWGVDPAISHISVAFADTKSEGIEVRSLLTRTEEREGARLGLLDRQVRIAASQWADMFPPACVWVEQASGKFQKPQFLYAIGVIQAALFETLACPVWTIPSSTWKHRTLGYGNASKIQVLAWTDQFGFPSLSQDEADAVCIALAGRSMLLSGSWDVAT